MINGVPPEAFMGQDQPQMERGVFIPVELTPEGGVSIQGVSFRGLPQERSAPWTGWGTCHEILLVACKFAMDNLVSEMQKAGESYIVMPGGKFPPIG